MMVEVDSCVDREDESPAQLAPEEILQHRALS
jgi:hypothetical protein